MSASVFWDGAALSRERRPGARQLGLDPRCVEGKPVPGCWAQVSASADPSARLPYDDPAVQQVRRDVMGWWATLLGDVLVCLTTFALDEVHCGGGMTVVRDPALLAGDPFARLFAPAVVRVDFLAAVAPPAGPVVERYAGAPWPGGGF